MKEKFAFKVKIGLDKLDQFITDGITVSGQNIFFGQFRNPPITSVGIVGVCRRLCNVLYFTFNLYYCCCYLNSIPFMVIYK